MATAARADPGREACGLLLGRRRRGQWCVAAATVARNVAPAPARRFEIDPAHLLAAQRAAREPGAPLILGVWHSHPVGPARPSPLDRAGITEPDWLWLILARGGTEIAGWCPSAHAPGGFARVALALPARIDLAAAPC